MSELPELSPEHEKSEELFVLVYDELRHIARSKRRSLGNPQTLDTTSLVHETYLKLSSAASTLGYSRPHFLALAARAMRQILLNHARDSSNLKRGGEFTFTTLDHEKADTRTNLFDVVALDRALVALSAMDVDAGQLVEWHVFGGLSFEEIAALQGVTERTVYRHWRSARAFLLKQLSTIGEGDHGPRTLAEDQNNL